jgi:putative CocE/NonD family hydrolase
MNHPAHKAMIAMGPGAGIGSIPGVGTQGGFYKGGVPNLEWEGWYKINGHIHRPKLPADISQPERVRLADMYSPFLALTPDAKKRLKERALESRDELPSEDILRRIGVPETDFDKMITFSPADPRWRLYDLIHDGDHPRVPALYIDAWYDFTSFGTLKLFEYLQDTANQFLIVAPTAHCSMKEATEQTKVGERFLGDARYDYDKLIVEWFDYWLKDQPNNVLDRPKVQAYLMGTNVWKTYSSWPAPGVKTSSWFLHSDGHANSRLGTGQLSEAQSAAEPADAFVSDPLHPVPYQGGADDAPVAQDQGNIETRNDVLVYSSDLLKQRVVLTGEVKAIFYVSSTTPDADLALKLVDVYPDGRAFNVSDTMLRLRYRDGYAVPKLMKPGEVYRAELTGIATNNSFEPGHRIRIEIAGNNSHYERNLQTGGKNYEETRAAVATIQIYHSMIRPSHLELPIAAP